MTAEKIPVTVLSGSLGAGKTSTLNHLLETAGDRSIAVLVNDMGEINIDAELLSAGTELAADGGVAELSNGCICCERQDDLETEVARLAAERDFEYLVVEASGISEPAPIGRLFTTASRAAAAYELDTLATVIDANLFVETFGGQDAIERQTAPGSEDRPLSDLLVEQIEFSNVLLLNKCDLVDDAALEMAENLLSTLNPGASIVRTVHGRVDPDEILETHRFDESDLDGDAGIPSVDIAVDEGDFDHGEGSEHHDHDSENDTHHHGEHGGHHDHDHAGPEQTYGVTSVSYSRRRPFHPERLWSFLSELPENIIRSKGLCWIAGRADDAISYSHAGPIATFEIVGPWIAGLPEIEQELYLEGNPDIPWDDQYGDRRTELVFIGHDVEGTEIRKRLEDCLVTEDEWSGEESERVPGAEKYPTESDEIIELELNRNR